MGKNKGKCFFLAKKMVLGEEKTLDFSDGLAVGFLKGRILQR